MASPGSPPSGPHASLPNPKKRSSDFTLPSGQMTKRRKPSNLPHASAPPSAHPLRQTSFPPEPAGADRSPSVDAVSVASGSTAVAPGPPKKKRGRKPKNASVSMPAAIVDRERAPSRVGSSTTPSLVGGRQTGGAAEEEDAEEDTVNMAVMDASEGTLEQRKEELRLRAMLVEALDEEQYARYELWRVTRLSEAAIRRVINTTVSQSVPPTVTLTVKTVTKLFAAKIIEMARQVQAEWIAAGEQQADVPLPPPPEGAAAPRDLRGPLRPDHLREAWRRYRTTGEGGGVGTHALWHAQQESGVGRFATRTGKRIFR